MTLVNTAKMASLPSEAQQQLAADLRSDLHSKQAISARLEARVPDQAESPLGPFIRALQRHLEALEGHADEVRSVHAFDIAILERVGSVIGAMLKQVRKAK